MSGMFDAVLNLGLTARTVAGLVHASGDTGARTAAGRHLAPGDDVTLDGITGEVWFGGDPDSSGPAPTDERTVLARDLPALSNLDGWTAHPDRAELP